jgi:hypothetical protein
VHQPKCAHSMNKRQNSLRIKWYFDPDQNYSTVWWQPPSAGAQTPVLAEPARHIAQAVRGITWPLSDKAPAGQPTCMREADEEAVV